MKNRVKVQLMGGIGNQLFQYSAAKYIAINSDSSILLDTSRIGVGGTNHGSNLRELGITEKEVSSTFRVKFYKSIFGRAHYMFLRKYSFYRQINRHLFHYYQSSTVGFDRKLVGMSAPVVLNGYFQTPFYLNEVIKKTSISFEIDNPSDWYLRLKKEIESQSVLIVHIRRGDYVGLKETFGLLDSSYYKNAVEKASTAKQFQSIYVFSDDIESAINVMAGVKNQKIIFVSPPKNSSAAESLILMSRGAGIVISNSTFAWWAATIGKIETVICPNPWFRNFDQHEEIANSNWIPMESIWED